MVVEAAAAVAVGNINNDRDLLSALGLSDAQAAAFLGKSRQALNNMLGSRRSGEAPNDYFKASDVLVLLIAARRKGHDFDESEVRRYVEIRPKRGDSDALDMVLSELGPRHDALDHLPGAEAVVMIVPDYDDLLQRNPKTAARLDEFIDRVIEADSDPWLVLLASSNEMRATSAARGLGLAGPKVRPVGHPYIDHYTPMVLIYGTVEEKDDPRSFLFTEKGDLVEAPFYRAAMLSACVKHMLPAEVRNDIFPVMDRAAARQQTRESNSQGKRHSAG